MTSATAGPSLWHLGGVPAAQASAWLGHSPAEHLRTCAHVVIDRTEIDYSQTTATTSAGEHLLSR